MKQLYFGDCLDVLKKFAREHPKGFIDLIYIDPPFNSKRDYNILFEHIEMEDTKAQREAFTDTWSNVSYIDSLNELADLHDDVYQFLKTLDRINISTSTVSYLTTMAIRIFYMHKVLKDTGSFYLHCDPNMSHYLKVICDLIFGRNVRFNELIWCYKEREISKKQWNKKHDVILFYTKSMNNKFNWELVAEDYSLGTYKKFNYVDENGRRFQIRGKGGPYLGKQGLSIELESTHPEWVYRDYLDKSPGVPPRDWFIIPVINRASKERLGYPTQKPEALLEKIILASSNEGDLVADFFCGCGTTIAVANRLNRQWIGVDISHLAIRLVLKRLTDPYDDETKKSILKEIEIHGFPRDIASAKELANKGTKGRLEFQYWVVEILLGGIVNPKKSADGGWDGYISFAKSENERGKILIEVKSGSVNINMIRSFIQVVEKQNADLGFFVCFKEYVTDSMKSEAKKVGKYNGFNIDRIQIITIEDLLEGNGPKLPGGADPTIFKKATKEVRPINNNDKLFYD
ncbi:MAG: Type III restriction-modification system methylation subunit [Candidatus Kapaibacterium sp.]|nr:MAG: Type III restriction-modification system methylation subunit [Candidatus Kapabacteria bacterium]